MTFAARFDVEAGRFRLTGCREAFVATSTDEVVGVLDAAEAAAAAGSWVAGFVSYEAAPGLDPHLRVRTRPHDDPLGRLPLAWFGTFDDRVSAPQPARPPGLDPGPAWELEWTARQHAAVVDRVKDLIAAGLTYQVNLTARAHTTTDDPAALYARLLRAQAGRHSAYIETSSHAVACASPELFFAVDGTHLVTRPMKGTARRGRWPAEDVDAASRLQCSPKERAENVMIVDLVRNDVGRIARTGSVTVPTLLELERYPQVWQLTSGVEGELPEGTRLASVFQALFPSGSVTGAPKRTTMDMIAELEPRPRGVYCGAVGVVAPGPGLNASFAVAIRTATTNLDSGYTEYGTGGGITWASDAAKEWDELKAKATILDQPCEVDGLFETMRREQGVGIVNREAHLDRLGASAAYFSIPFAPAAAIEAITAVDEPARVRLDLHLDGTLRVTEQPLPDSFGPLRLGLSREPVDSRAVVMFHKIRNRERYERRSQTAVDDVVLVNERGEVTETTIANLAVRLDGRWWTPTLGCGLLPGVERARLLDAGVLAERVITVDELVGAAELAVVSSLRGWRPARLVEPCSDDLDRPQPAFEGGTNRGVGGPTS